MPGDYIFELGSVLDKSISSYSLDLPMLRSDLASDCFEGVCSLRLFKCLINSYTLVELRGEYMAEKKA
jgi:hypothetical protein